MKSLVLKDNLGQLKQISENMYEDVDTGYLHCKNVIMGRTGIQKYKGYEMGLTGKYADMIINVERPPEEVFDKASLASLEDKAFTVSHPGEDVNITNDTELRKGTCKNIREEDGVIKGDIIVYDAETIELIKDKELREVSLGYKLELEKVTDTKYIARNIRYNHCALVYKGRAGVAKILDALLNYKNNNKGGSMDKKDKRSLLDRILGKPISDESYKELVNDDAEDEVVEDEQEENQSATETSDSKTESTEDKEETESKDKKDKKDKKDSEEENKEQNAEQEDQKDPEEKEEEDPKSEDKEETKSEEDECEEKKKDTKSKDSETETEDSKTQDSKNQEKAQDSAETDLEDESVENKEKESDSMSNKITAKDIDNLSKEELKNKLKDSQDEYDDLVDSEVADTKKVSIYDKAIESEKESQHFYRKLNPHTNPNFKDETITKSDIRNRLEDFKFDGDVNKLNIKK